ncbi:Response regulator receiver domain-containing protein [Ekhidna lutea]|uniref:Response regulator receiver domain-containing protein n=1 Tax=Ekhidna lutea TaxID=447679 RepID=A0A239JZH5_EKHLU|nr:response regulator [Ekhidna lutea]SNT11466.1 Response regulator receiver domain-containing protein [Ekhidna lutea]
MSKKIIVAEDSSVIQNLTKKILSQLNYEISSVKNGQQVLDLLQKEDYSLVLLDIHMPIMDGMECAKQIRSMPGNNSEIPIVAITGNANNYTMEDFEEVGINAFIPKPLNYDSVVEMVKKYTDDN